VIGLRSTATRVTSFVCGQNIKDAGQGVSIKVAIDMNVLAALELDRYLARTYEAALKIDRQVTYPAHRHATFLH
jgi:hypothetical protein